MATFSSITELAHDLGVTPRTIRFYEDKGLITPQRAGNARIYTARDRTRMALILRGKRLGFSLKDIRGLLDLYMADATQPEQLQALADGIAARLAQLRKQRQAVETTLTELREIAHACREALDGQGPQQTGGKPSSQREAEKRQ